MNIIKQSLILPFDKCYLSASYKNLNYKAFWGYNHLGWDLCTYDTSTKDKIYSSGVGEVVSAGLDSKVGYVLAIKYYNVYNSSNNRIYNIIARYMHMSKLSVKVGDKVEIGTELGNIGGYGKTPTSYDIHLHIEFDVDISHPNMSGQVSGGSIFKAGTSNTMVNPKEIFHLANNQQLGGSDKVYIKALQRNDYMYDKDDLTLPRASKTEIKESVSVKSQQLILPINNCIISAGYKNKKYESLIVNGVRMGTHFGNDLYGELQLWCSGDGTVLSTGIDNCFGNYVVVQYDNVYNHKTKKASNYVFRYFHLADISVKKGQKVTSDTRLGIMGNTGKYAAGVHLHIEADTDVKNWQFTPSLTGNSNIFKAGYRGNNDTTLDIFELLYIKSSTPDNQKLKKNNDGYVDINVSTIPVKK